MINDFVVLQILNNRLLSLPAKPASQQETIFLPNELVDADFNDPHLIADILNGDDQSIGLSASSEDLQESIYQIRIRTKTGTAAYQSMEIKNRIKSHFPKFLKLTQDSVVVKIMELGVSPPYNDDGWYTIALSVNFTVVG